MRQDTCAKCQFGHFDMVELLPKQAEEINEQMNEDIFCATLRNIGEKKPSLSLVFLTTLPFLLNDR